MGQGRSLLSVCKQMVARILTGNSNSEWRESGTCQVIDGVESYGFNSIGLGQIDTDALIAVAIQKEGNKRQIFPAEIPVATATHLPDKGLLILEEINQASEGTRVIVQQMILEHKLVGVAMKAGWNKRNLSADSSFVIQAKHLVLTSTWKMKWHIPHKCICRI